VASQLIEARRSSVLVVTDDVLSAHPCRRFVDALLPERGRYISRDSCSDEGR